MAVQNLGFRSARDGRKAFVGMALLIAVASLWIGRPIEWRYGSRKAFGGVAFSIALPSVLIAVHNSLIVYLFPILGTEGIQDYRYLIEMLKKEILHILHLSLYTYINL